MSVWFQADPCLQHTFQFLLFFTQSYEDTHGVQIARSAKNEYNKEGNKNYPYGGLLATEVLPNICLKENGTISTSDLPQALQYCGVAFSHVEGAEFHRCHSNCNHDDKETGQARRPYTSHLSFFPHRQEFWINFSTRKMYIFSTICIVLPMCTIFASFPQDSIFATACGACAKYELRRASPLPPSSLPLSFCQLLNLS